MCVVLPISFCGKEWETTEPVQRFWGSTTQITQFYVMTLSHTTPVSWTFMVYYKKQNTG
jgi:hypothetical protein